MRSLLAIFVVALVLAQVAEGINLKRKLRSRAQGLSEVDEELLEVQSAAGAHAKFGSPEHWAIGGVAMAELATRNLSAFITVKDKKTIPADFFVAYQGDFLDSSAGPFCSMSLMAVKDWIKTTINGFNYKVYSDIKTIIDDMKKKIGDATDDEPNRVGGDTGENWDQDLAIASRGKGLQYFPNKVRPPGSYLEDVVFEDSPYITMASRNYDHFKDKDCARKAYSNFHHAAFDYIKAGDTNSAIFAEFASYHYLTDLFAGGHSRTPRGVLADVCSQGKSGSDAATAKKVAGLLAKCQHDLDNKNGVEVSSVNSPTPWTAYGDDHYYLIKNKENREHIAKAVLASFVEIFDPIPKGQAVPAMKAETHIPSPTAKASPALFKVTVDNKSVEVRNPMLDGKSYAKLSPADCLPRAIECYELDKAITSVMDSSVVQLLQKENKAFIAKLTEEKKAFQNFTDMVGKKFAQVGHAVQQEAKAVVNDVGKAASGALKAIEKLGK